MADKKSSGPQEAFSELFEGERLELIWRYAYRPEFQPLLISYLAATQGMKILESGCGTGFLSRLLVKNLEDVHITAVDLDEKLLELGREMANREKLSDKIKFQKGDAYKLPFPDESFDLVTSQTLL